MSLHEIILPNHFTNDTLPCVMVACGLYGSQAGRRFYTGSKADCEAKLSAILAEFPDRDWLAFADEFHSAPICVR